MGWEDFLDFSDCFAKVGEAIDFSLKLMVVMTRRSYQPSALLALGAKFFSDGSNHRSNNLALLLPE